MRYFKTVLATIALNIFPLVHAETPKVGIISTSQIKEDCPAGEVCGYVDPDICSPTDILVSENNDNTFDLLFTRFTLSTEGRGVTLAKAGCKIALRVDVPENKRAYLSRVSVAGFAAIPDGGEASTSISHHAGRRSSTRTETFSETNTFAVSHQQELTAEFSRCNETNLQFETQVNVQAKQSPFERNSTEVMLTSGSGQVRYELKYQDCGIPPDCNQNNALCSDQDISTEIEMIHQWDGGYCANVNITNHTAAPVKWRKTLAVDGTVLKMWNAEWNQAGSSLVFSGLDSNEVIESGETISSIGMCVNTKRQCSGHERKRRQYDWFKHNKSRDHHYGSHRKQNGNNDYRRHRNSDKNRGYHRNQRSQHEGYSRRNSGRW